MDYLDSLDSSSDLQPIRAKKIVNRFYLILQISKIPFQKILAKWSKHTRDGNGMEIGKRIYMRIQFASILRDENMKMDIQDIWVSIRANLIFFHP